METLLKEVRLRCLWILIGLALTWFTSYCFAQEFIFLLAKPFLIMSRPTDSSFLCTQLTEAFSTYLATASIACSYFIFPFLSYQIWAFVIPSCYKEERKKYNRLFYLSGFCFFFFLFLTSVCLLPNLFHFLYFMGETSANSFIIKLEPKIYDYIILTFRIFFISALCSQVPVILISLLEIRALSLESFTNNRRLLMLFSLLTAALATPPDIWCQIVAPCLIFALIEFTIFMAAIVQVRQE